MAKILVVDDSEKIREFIQTALASDGHQIILAKDAFESKEILKKYKFDLMILDINMPYQNGFDALKGFRQQLSLKYLPVIFISGRHTARDVQRAVELGAMDYIVKPINIDELKSKVQSVLDRINVKTKTDSIVIPNDFIYAKAKIKLELNYDIKEISEFGLSILSNQILLPGTVLKISSPLFSYIGIEEYDFKVVSCAEDEDMYKVKMVFQNISHEDIAQIKTWLSSAKPFQKKLSKVS